MISLLVSSSETENYDLRITNQSPFAYLQIGEMVDDPNYIGNPLMELKNGAFLEPTDCISTLIAKGISVDPILPIRNDLPENHPFHGKRCLKTCIAGIPIWYSPFCVPPL